MFKLTKKELFDYSQASGFQKDSLEKVFRLIEILKFTSSHPVFNPLKLKGGTALQLAIFDFKRLSVDIDFDYHSDEDREIMQEKRNEIKDLLIRFMQSQTYSLSPHSKFPYSLDSFIFSYRNLAGNLDNIKIDINYTNRKHVLDPEMFVLNHSFFDIIEVPILSELELYATKINALIARTVPRDLYDTYLIVKENKIAKNDHKLLKSMIVFYLVLSNPDIDLKDALENAKQKITKMTFYVIKKTLIPLLSKKEQLNIKEAATIVNAFLDEVFMFEENEVMFVKKANDKVFDLSLLFDDQVVEKLKKHPRILWMLKNKDE